jgi:hypothetical protein
VGFLDDAVARQRARKDPLGRLPWPVQLLGLLLVVSVGVGQLVVGGGGSKAFGALMLVVVAPAQAVATWATWKVSTER